MTAKWGQFEDSVMDKKSLNARESGAIENLEQYQGQCDEEGICVAVSRQALEELLGYVADLERRLEEYAKCNLRKQIEESEPTLRDQFAMAAPAKEIEDIVPSTRGDVCEFLGLDVDLNADRYAYPKDALLRATVKARYIWADAMLKAREVK